MRQIATVHLEPSATAADEQEIIRRLDDGNDYPAMQVDLVSDDDSVFGVFVEEEAV